MERNQDLILLLGQIDGKLDRVIDKQDNQDDRMDSHGERLRSLEDTKAKYIGAHTILGAIISFIVSWFTSHRG